MHYGRPHNGNGRNNGSYSNGGNRMNRMTSRSSMNPMGRVYNSPASMNRSTSHGWAMAGNKTKTFSGKGVTHEMIAHHHGGEVNRTTLTGFHTRFGHLPAPNKGYNR